MTKQTHKGTIMNLNELNIINREIDLDNGFFFVEFGNGKSIQCCLDQLSSGEFVAKITESDCGHDEGICADINEWVHNDDAALNTLIQQALLAGVEVEYKA